MDRLSFAERQFLRTEELDVRGEELASNVRSMIFEGSVRRLILRNEEGHVLIEMPVPAEVTEAASAPMLAAAAAIGALAADRTIRIEKEIQVFEDEAEAN